jgi:CheY-like chemotaxis protein
VFVRDLTAKLAAEEQLRQSQKIEAVGQLTGGIAHDFNNILTVITSSIDFLAKGVADTPKLAANAQLIRDAAGRGAELTSHLLAFARKQPLQPKETDINALMVESAKLLGTTLGGHVEFESRLEPAVWPALVDANQLTTALVNLAVNARDAMVDGGKLTLETSNVVLEESSDIDGGIQPGHYVVIAVSDTGAGIPEEIREKVFEPFFSTKDAGKGTGLGLSMVYGFAKQSGGHVKLYSEVGRGTTVKLFLPRAERHVHAQSEVTQSRLAEGGAETILVVEDHPLVRKSVTMQLEGLGYTVICTANATEALAAIKRGVAFDLLFTDVLMPGGMNGQQLAGEAAKLRPSLKVLFTSGFTKNAFTHNGNLEPGVLLLSKPYVLIDLARMVRKALGTRPNAHTEAPVQKQTGHTDSTPQGDGELILVVEDDDLARKVTLERLEALGYAVIEARSGPEAVERLKSDEPIALVFSDIVMRGGMTGHDLARWVLAAKPCMKVLLTSRYNAERGSNAMAHIKVLAKPYTFTGLAHSIHEALDTGSAQAAVTSAVNT